MQKAGSQDRFSYVIVNILVIISLSQSCSGHLLFRNGKECINVFLLCNVAE